MIAAIAPPWTATLTNGQYLITVYFLVVAGLALFSGFVRTLVSRNEVGSRYRTATVARLSVTGVATVSYLFIVILFLGSYHSTGHGYVPGGNAVLVLAARYMDWSVTVPLLTVELLGVCVLAGAAARRVQFIALTSSFLMIFTGFIGAFVAEPASADVSDGRVQLVFWGIVSCIFWVVTMLVLIRAVRSSLPELTPEAGALLRSGTVLLLSGWVIYPIVYAIQIFTSGGGWATTVQIVLCTADVIIKIGFGNIVHRVAKLRTAEDVRAGDDVHAESIWISSVKQSDAGTPREVYLAADAIAHVRRPQPPGSEAIASDETPVGIDI